MGKIMVLTALLFILFSPTVSHSVETAYEQHIARGVSYMQALDFGGAAAEFDLALKERPEDFTATLYLGIAQSRLGDKRAEISLKKALALKPRDARASFELGVYYFNAGQYTTSRDYLGDSVSISPNTEISEIAEEYLRAISRGKALKPWTVNIALGTQYDSNVLLSEAGGPLPQGISRKADWSAVAYLKGEYNFYRTERTEASASYSFYQSLHAKLSDFNVTYNLFDIRATYALSRMFSMRGIGDFEYSFIGGNDYDAAYSLSPAIIISEGGGYSTVVEYIYNRTRFMNSALFFDNSDRTGSDNLEGVTQNIPLLSSVLARIAYSHDVDSARQLFWSYRGDKVLVGFQLSLPRDIYVDLHGDYTHRDYKGIFETSSENRKDKIYNVSISATKVLSQYYSVTIGQEYLRNQSNTSVFDYNRAITSLFLNARF